MALIKLSTRENCSFNKHTQTYYVYENTTYLDEETGTKSTKRRLIGKRDPVTGQTVPTRKRSSSKPNSTGSSSSDELLSQYRKRADQAEKQSEFDRNAKQRLIEELKHSAESYSELIQMADDERRRIYSILKTFGT